jgi:pSer/pThr/pTyr-binding forkhead associated (FHA) protein
MQALAGPDADGVGFPPFCPERRFPLTGRQFLVGRRSRSRGIEPEIDLTGPPEDPGVSHAHAILLAQEGGGWAVVDLDSANGTYLNDSEDPIEPNLPVPVSAGDRIHVGAWTTLTLHAESPA